jgi:V/A-type H+-transporting ATPase subunit E
LGLEELLGSLKKNKQKQIDTIWQAVNTEAESLRKQIAEAIADITKNHAEQLASACKKSMRSIFAETEIKTRKKKLFVYHALEQALRNAAVKQLPLLREKDYDTVFAQLVAELPERTWEKIAVSPADRDLATAFFSAGIIDPDPGICGGLVAITDGGRITVDNTFEKRLEKKWPHILPAIIEKIEKHYGESGSIENNT